MDRNVFLALMVISGFLIGLASFHVTQSGDQGRYCDRIADNIRSNQSFNGTISCYPPNGFSINESGEVENQTDLQCICRRGFNGNEQIFTIRKTR